MFQTTFCTMCYIQGVVYNQQLSYQPQYHVPQKQSSGDVKNVPCIFDIWAIYYMFDFFQSFRHGVCIVLVNANILPLELSLGNVFTHHMVP